MTTPKFFYSLATCVQRKFACSPILSKVDMKMIIIDKAWHQKEPYSSQAGQVEVKT